MGRLLIRIRTFDREQAAAKIKDLRSRANSARKIRPGGKELFFTWIPDGVKFGQIFWFGTVPNAGVNGGLVVDLDTSDQEKIRSAFNQDFLQYLPAGHRRNHVDYNTAWGTPGGIDGALLHRLGHVRRAHSD